MKKNKKMIIAVLSICLVAAIAIGGTIAFLFDKQEVTNTFTVGNLDITLTEPNWNDETDGKDLMPGDTEVKDPTITEVANDSYMRVKMSVVDADGNLITDGDRLALVLETVRFDSTYTDAENIGTALVEGSKYSRADLADVPAVNPAFTVDSTRTEANTGVYFYNYNTVLAQGSKAVLFTNIVIPTDWTQTELQKVGSYKLVLEAQAIQTDGFANAAEAFTALDAEIAKA